MKGNPARPGGSSVSKPAWSNTSGIRPRRLFFRYRRRGRPQPPGTNPMDKPPLTMAQQIAQAASDFERQRTGHAPKSVTVVLSDDTLVITLHGALTPAEKALVQSSAGAVQVQEFHRQ